MGEYYLKILSGNHIGAEIPLEPGQYSLGKDESCDLVLSDAALRDNELIIQITPEGQLNIFPKHEEDPLYHNGQPVDKPFTMAAFDVITASNLFFTLGSADADWPDITLPELQRPEPDEKSEQIDSDTTSEAEDSDDGLPDVDLDEDSDDEDDVDDLELGYETDFLTSEEDSDDESNKPAPPPAIIKKILIGLPLSLILIIILLAVFLIAEEAPQTAAPENKPIDYALQAKTIRDELNQKHVRVKKLPDKSVLLTGYTNTLKDKQNFLRNLSEQNIPFTSQLVIMNELRASADALLQNRGYSDIRLELDNTPGSLVMTGYVASAEELTNLIDMLKQEIHGLVSVVDQVENQSSRLNTLKSMLREKNLSSRIHLVQKTNLITLEGHLLDDEQVYNLNDVVSRFRKRYRDNPVLKVATRSANDNKDQKAGLLPSLRIRGISMGRVPYVIMEDGGKYLIGAKLANGYIIDDINLDYLLLIKGTDRVKYRLGGNRDGQKKQ
ncbi:type III secretion system inner membrane ring subunit SctD [Endozoicomonas gorgoniicola]|uniref:Type III secretion system inner membrane ring subunit SctD n=1 Tax=Endozoicomonas gorgoniicola TaxID=1234144 RepID=A0ABT3MRC1_9GAMM|nr:type III secretion system inner membrane ring subunit SctD [Endozoicomonas gorgoniicola]MCW7551919.1 type III secretion system inner membrane ring subunit SctD [Endozoicomonas gorgoniicola]